MKARLKFHSGETVEGEVVFMSNGYISDKSEERFAWRFGALHSSFSVMSRRSVLDFNHPTREAALSDFSRFGEIIGDDDE